MAKIEAHDVTTEISHAMSDSQDAEKAEGNLELHRTQSAPVIYPPFKVAVLVLICTYLCTFLIALDSTILATATPSITNAFKSFNDIGWYGSSYLISRCALQLFFGKLYTFYSPKWVFLVSIGIFEIGSALCGAAPSSLAFILGRSIAGIGSAGLSAGCLILIVAVLPLHKRPMWIGLNGAVFGVASILGPLLGGVFTTYVSWRWCFFINLPFGAFAAIVVFFAMKSDEPLDTTTQTFKERFMQFDLLGSMCLIPGIICLLLALQWGGSLYAWSDGRTIALLVLFVVLIGVFMVLQFVRKPEHVMIQPAILRNRSVVAGLLFTICASGTLITMDYYLPIWFQAIKLTTAVGSGIRCLPFVASAIISIVISGILLQKVGYYTVFMLVSAAFMSIGSGLFTLLRVNSGPSHWASFGVIAGIGIGTGLQMPNIAAQVVLNRRQVSMGTALIMLGQSLGGGIFVSVTQSVLNNRLVNAVAQLDVPGLDASTVMNTGATQLRDLVPAAQLPAFVRLYNEAIVHGAFYVAVALSVVSMIGALCMEWKSVQKRQPASATEDHEAKTEGAE